MSSVNSPPSHVPWRTSWSSSRHCSHGITPLHRHLWRYIHTCMCVCVFVCVCTCAYVFVCVCIRACMCVCISVCMCIHWRVCTCVSACAHVYWGTLLFTEWYLLFLYPFSQNSDSVSVCAAVVRYSLLDKPRTGVCTTFLQDRCDVSSSIPVFISTNHDFRLPGKGDVPIIMIGPGTGLAPFRAFIQERSEGVFLPIKVKHFIHIEKKVNCCVIVAVSTWCTGFAGTWLVGEQCW